ncbi:MAG: metallophosphoesterase family protein [Chloroflexi bacterium]|nr:metallophosphoesterase family protein [Chloroflexota bacterium]MCY4246973.1 metallophosphoesterase family protein [Chloroflexota bacterium]
MKILCVSDTEMPQLRSAVNLRRHYKDIDLVISCGDMLPAYLEYITSILQAPLYYVRGNRDERYRKEPPGGIDLHRQIVQYRGLTMTGLEGCIRYNNGEIQYSQTQMHGMVFGLSAKILAHRWLRRRGIDLFVTHSPARDIHDGSDVAHRGFTSFRNFMRWFRPRYMLHGHVHTWDRRKTVRTQFQSTCVINVNPFTVLELNPR